MVIEQSPFEDTKCNQVKRLNYTDFKLLHEALNKYEYLKGRYIIVPNVSEGGSSTLLRSGHAIHYREMPCIGGYLDGDIGRLGVGNRNILEGKNGDYGHKALGIFQTSDNRRSDFKDLGTSTTWVKWAEPTAEALRQACLARDSRLSQTEPTIPLITLTSINVSNSAFLGPFNLELNNQFNAIIGGRGTGKSTILEYIRWALCDEPPVIIEGEELPNYQVRRARLVNQTLTSLKANVEVNFIVNQVRHTVRRDAANDELTLKIGDGDFESCRESDIRNILPIQAYSQKQLSSIAVRIEELLRFIHAPIRKNLDNFNNQLGELEGNIRSVYSDLQRKRLIQRAIENDERLLKSLTEQVSTTRQGLEGLGKAEQDILSKYSDFEKEEEIVTNWLGDIEQIRQFLNDLGELINTASESRTDIGQLPNAKILKRMENEILTLFEKIKQMLTDTMDSLNAMNIDGSSFSTVTKEWEKKHEEYIIAYRSAKEKSSANEATLMQLEELEDQLKELRTILRSSKTEIKKIGNPEKQFNSLRNQWCSLHEKRAKLVEKQCKSLTKISGNQIRATLEKGALLSEVVKKLKSIGARIRGEKIDHLCAFIAEAEKPIYKYREILDELELLALHDSSEPTMKFPATPSLKHADFTDVELTRIADKLIPEMWLQLCVLQLGDKPVFEYQRKEGEFIAFENASVGQQATSLLWALLNQPGPPLIIDQPEDDLDNRMIFDVAKQIWKAKKQRQLIFSSHNANIVVNGDAELVICCDYRVAGQQSGGQIKYEGAIDVRNVRNEITRVTEGGPEAFRLRKDKYGF